MRMILLLSFLFSFNVLAQKVPRGTTLAYINIYFDSLESVDSSLSKDKIGLVENLALNGPGRVFLWTKDSSLRPLRDIKKDFSSKSITLNLSLSGDQFKKYSDDIAKCLQQSQQQFYQNQGTLIRSAVFWRNDDLEKVYKSNKALPINLTIAPDYGFLCNTGKK